MPSFDASPLPCRRAMKLLAWSRALLPGSILSFLREGGERRQRESSRGRRAWHSPISLAWNIRRYGSLNAAVPKHLSPRSISIPRLSPCHAPRGRLPMGMVTQTTACPGVCSFACLVTPIRSTSAVSSHHRQQVEIIISGNYASLCTTMSASSRCFDQCHSSRTMMMMGRRAGGL